MNKNNTHYLSALMLTLMIIAIVTAISFHRQTAPIEANPASISALPGSETTPSQNPTSQAQHREDPLGSVDKKSPFLPFQKHNRTVLMTDADRNEYQAALADSTLIGIARERLSTPPAGEFESEVTARMDAVEYLGSSIAYENNPNMEKALAAVDAVLHTSAEGLSEKARKSLLADQAELYDVLFAYHAEKAAALAKSAQGTNLEKVIKFSRGYFALTKGTDL